MVADAKRKEARKRKFGQLPKMQSVKNGNIVSENPDAGASPSKKARIKLTSEVSGTAPHGRQPSGSEETANCNDLGSDTQEAVGTNSVPRVKKIRFLCFVGNLPFSATTESVAQHFAKIQPRSIRHPTSKDTGKSKGFAFLEFDSYDRLKTCLSTFHHSDFDDGLSPARQINVELTAGGGGAKSKERKAKLLEKNARLNEQRKRKAVEEAKGAEGPKKGLDRTKKGVDVAKGGADDAEKGGGAHGVAEGSLEYQSAIHPSRRSRVSNK